MLTIAVGLVALYISSTRVVRLVVRRTRSIGVVTLVASETVTSVFGLLEIRVSWKPYILTLTRLRLNRLRLGAS